MNFDILLILWTKAIWAPPSHKDLYLLAHALVLKVTKRHYKDFIPLSLFDPAAAGCMVMRYTSWWLCEIVRRTVVWWWNQQTNLCFGVSTRVVPEHVRHSKSSLFDTIVFSVLFSIVVRLHYDVMMYVQEVTVFRPGCGCSNVNAG